jgi:ComF family protein
MREAIHALKYDKLHPVAHELGRMLAEAIAKLADKAPGVMLVIPVPLHRRRYAERGFNQARVLAAEALRFLGKSHPEWKLTLAASTLMRLRATQSQAGLTPRQRRLNLRGAFSVTDPAQVAGCNVLLIDDILTTGATARAASKALMDAGAKSVWVATLARARRVAGVGAETVYMDSDDEAGDGGHGSTRANSLEGFDSDYRGPDDRGPDYRGPGATGLVFRDSVSAGGLKLHGTTIFLVGDEDQGTRDVAW